MKFKFVHFLAALPAVAILTAPAWGADPTNAPASPEATPKASAAGKEEMRERFKNLTPEQRETLLKEMREKRGSADRRPEFDKNRESNLPPSGREARLKDLKEKNPGMAGMMEKRREEWDKLTPEQREARMKELRKEREGKTKEWRDKMEANLKELREKKAKGTLTEEETKNLAKMEEMFKRIEDHRKSPPAAPAPAP